VVPQSRWIGCPNDALSDFCQDRTPVNCFTDSHVYTSSFLRSPGQKLVIIVLRVYLLRSFGACVKITAHDHG
jgi:hypothetical protein